MRLLWIAALAVSSCFAAPVNFSVPLDSVVHAPRAFRKASKAQRFMLITNLAVHGLNIADAYTTYRGPILRPGQFCENNPVLTTAPCTISTWRFGFAKAAVAGAAIGEYVPTWTKKRPDAYYWFFGVLNLGAAIPLGLADAGNIKALSRN